jgi:hypothetical protein
MIVEEEETSLADDGMVDASRRLVQVSTVDLS